MLPPLSLVYQVLSNPQSPPSTLPLQKQQKQDCYLLNLPADILQLIDKYLPYSGRVCTRLTCSALYNSLKNPINCPYYCEHLECLALICRHRPDCWLVETRPYIRDVLESDMPNPPNVRPETGCPSWSEEAIYLFQRGALMAEFKHVRLAIGYSQLETKTCQQARYLKLLLEPYKTVFKPDYMPGPLGKAMELGYFKQYPKVVSGRYLTFSQRRFINNRNYTPVELYKLGCFGACMHQYTKPERYEDFLARQSQAMWKRFTDDQTGPKGPNRRHPECSDPFYQCLRNAYYMHGIWFDDLCPWCLTEFSVCVTKSGDLVINTWRDLGNADTPMNNDWWNHLDYFPHARCDTGRNPWVIRTRYGNVDGGCLVF
ncbi:hypothetical protein FPOA_01680 [Fusarium poae]|uniref:F-box domain-containing protein n=1 Tax=Fusarium poae TaxID=36050 RepID=A0A1B8B4U1_FUSPO|nr:hypothetical protein FPOA_01680 [Fusarium poae]